MRSGSAITLLLRQLEQDCMDIVFINEEFFMTQKVKVKFGNGINI